MDNEDLFLKGENEDLIIKKLIDEIEQREKINGKNFKQMTNEERWYVLSAKDTALKKKVCFAKHAIKRMNERNIKAKEIFDTLKNGQVIDYRVISNNEILTLRGCHLNRYNEQVYVVFSITTRKIITAYTNKYKTSFKKMKNLERYNEEFNIKIPYNYHLQYKMCHL